MIKKVVLSTVAVLAMSSFAHAGEAVAVTSKAQKLDISGTAYFGLTAADPKTTTTANGDTSKYAAASTGFELRRAYLQLKAYFNDKDFFRVTLDTTKELASGTSHANMYAKYAYLYVNNVLPFTGVEVGIAHRPWIDYEEHNAWKYRSFNKVFLEEKSTATEAGVDLVNSADLGVNFKTKTENFSSEIGIFNGEGYHADKDAANQENSKDLSLEWRLTGHLIGSGNKVGHYHVDKDTYLNVSTYGLMSKNHKDEAAALDSTDATQVNSKNVKGEYDRSIYGVHAVYNQPMFLVAAQYFVAEDKAQDTVNTGGRKYDGWSINGEVRPMKDVTLVGRYDAYSIDKVAKGTGTETLDKEGTKVMAAVAYKYNKNVNFIASGKFITEENAAGKDTGESKNVYMLTSEVKF